VESLAAVDKALTGPYLWPVAAMPMAFMVYFARFWPVEPSFA